MGTPTVPYKIMADGYEVEGDLASGYRATVPFLVDWADAFVFCDQIAGSASATKVGPVTYHMPWLFPAATARLYVKSFRVKPVGVEGAALGPTQGLAPGEFWSKALVTVQFETPSYTQTALDDPNNLSQLDPANPITLCEQSFKLGGKMVTRKGSGYVFSDGKALTGDVATPEKETRLVLKFPRIPFIPWQLLQPYIGRLNLTSVLGCDPGTLILEGGEVQFQATTQGLQGQQFVLEFTWQQRDWNMMVRPDTGTWDRVYKRGHLGDPTEQIFDYAEFKDIFNELAYTVLNT